MVDQERNRGRRIGIAIGFLVASAGAILGGVYLRRFEAEVSGGERVAVLYTSRDIVAGAPISSDLLSVRQIPAAYVDDRMVQAKDKDQVVGIEAVIPVNAQQALQWSDLAVRTDIRNLSQLVPPGKRAVTIQASRKSQQQNIMIRPGDYVDVIASTTISPDGIRKERATTVLLQRVLVVAVGLSTERNMEQDKKYKGREEKVLTLSVEIDEAQLLTLAMGQGTVSVAVRNPEDQKIQEDLPDMQASSLIEARDAVRARKKMARAAVKAPIKLTEAR